MENTNLSKVANLNDAAVATFDVFAKRQRFRSNTNLSRFHRELEDKYGTINEDELLQTFKGLEQAGMGSLIVGRKKTKTRFIWNYSLRDVAKLAKGEVTADDLHKIPRAKPARIIRRSAAPQPVTAAPVPAPIEQASPVLEVILLDGQGNAEKFVIPANRQDAFKMILSSLTKT